MAWHRKYSINGSVTVASSAATTIILTSTTAIEPSIYYIGTGFESAPADNTFVIYAQRYTAAGTTTAVTPRNLGPSTVAATSSAGQTATVEPTYTAGAILWRLGLNQRASHSLVFDPDGCLTAPATASNGIGWYTSNASATPTHGMVVHYCE